MNIDYIPKSFGKVAWYHYINHGMQVQVYRLFRVSNIHIFGSPFVRTKVYVN